MESNGIFLMQRLHTVQAPDSLTSLRSFWKHVGSPSLIDSLQICASGESFPKICSVIPATFLNSTASCVPSTLLDHIHLRTEGPCEIKCLIYCVSSFNQGSLGSELSRCHFWMNDMNHHSSTVPVTLFRQAGATFLPGRS